MPRTSLKLTQIVFGLSVFVMTAFGYTSEGLAQTATIANYGETVNGVAGTIYQNNNDLLSVAVDTTLGNPTANPVDFTIEHWFDGELHGAQIITVPSGKGLRLFSITISWPGAAQPVDGGTLFQMDKNRK